MKICTLDGKGNERDHSLSDSSSGSGSGACSCCKEKGMDQLQVETGELGDGQGILCCHFMRSKKRKEEGVGRRILYVLFSSI